MRMKEGNSLTTTVPSKDKSDQGVFKLKQSGEIPKLSPNKRPQALENNNNGEEEK